tara:strand:- start:38 stop:322 length:285 start_codon:yes stop_codon:yes gene_type:complete
MNKYYNIVLWFEYYEITGSINGVGEILFGSFERSDCEYEKEWESDNWKEDGYRDIRIVSRLTSERPDPEVYGKYRQDSCGYPPCKSVSYERIQS